MANQITMKLIGGDRFVADASQWLMRLRHEIASASRKRAAEIASRTLSYYPHGVTGNLRKGLRVREVTSDNYQVQEQIKSRAPHAHLWEWGTKARHTRKGWNRGVMGKARVGMVPIAIQERAKLMRAIRAILSSPESALGPGRPDVVQAPDFFGNRGRL